MKNLKRIFGIVCVVFGVGVFVYQVYALGVSGEWSWVTLADIFPHWAQELTSDDSAFAYLKQWFITNFWLVAIALIPLFFTRTPSRGGDGYAGDWGDGGDGDIGF